MSPTSLPASSMSVLPVFNHVYPSRLTIGYETFTRLTLLLQAPCFLKALSLLGSGWIHSNPIRCGVQRSCSSGNLGSPGKARLMSFDHLRGMNFNMLYISYLDAVSALKLIACSDCRIMNDLCCGHAWTNGVTDCCFKLPFVVPPTRRMCPTSTWSPPSSPCSWTEQAAMLVF